MGSLYLYSDFLSNEIASTKILRYRHKIRRRIVALEKTTDSSGRPVMKVCLLTERGYYRYINFIQGQAEGIRVNGSEVHDEYMRLIYANGNDYTANPHFAPFIEESLNSDTYLRYDATNGQLVSIRTFAGIVTDIEGINSQLEVIVNGADNQRRELTNNIRSAPRGKEQELRQIWNKTDGLLDIITNDNETGYTIEWFAPENIAGKDPITGLYYTGAESLPIKKWTISAIENPGMDIGFEHLDGNLETIHVSSPWLNSVEILEEHHEMKFRTRWLQPDLETMIMIKGEGNEAVISHQVKQLIDDTTRSMIPNSEQAGIYPRPNTPGLGTPYVLSDSLEEITRYFKGEKTLQQILVQGREIDWSEVKLSSSERTVYMSFEFGDVVVMEESGSDSDSPQRFVYEYGMDKSNNNYGKVINKISDNGHVISFDYDEKNRIVAESEPWAGGGNKISLYSYYNERFNDNRMREQFEIIEKDGQQIPFKKTSFEYLETQALSSKTVTIEIPDNEPQVSKAEWYGPDASLNGSLSIYAAGQLKMEQVIDGYQKIYSYEDTTKFGAAYKVTELICANNEIISGLSQITVRYINLKGEEVAKVEAVHIKEENSLDTSDPNLWIRHKDVNFKIINHQTFEYNPSHKIVKINLANGKTTETRWMCSGAPLMEKDENNVVTVYEYNTSKQLIGIIREPVTLDLEKQIEYPNYNKPPVIKEYENDAKNRTLKITTKIGNLETEEITQYDLLGRVTRQIGPEGQISDLDYSFDGLTSTITRSGKQKTIVKKHSDGSVLSETGNASQSKYYTYDIENNCLVKQVRVNTHCGPLVEETYVNGFGQTILTRKPGGKNMPLEEKNTYNKRGYLVKIEKTGKAPVYLEYDLLGNLSRKIVKLSAGEPDPAKDRITNYNYFYTNIPNLPVYSAIFTDQNTIGEVIQKATMYETKIWYIPSTSQTPIISKELALVSNFHPELTSFKTIFDKHNVEALEYTLINGGVLEKHSDKAKDGVKLNGSIQFFIDDEKIEEMDKSGTITIYTRKWHKDGTSEIITDARGNATSFDYDKSNRLTKITDPEGYVSYKNYDLLNNLVKESYADGGIIEYSYNSWNLLAAKFGTATYPICYEYDEAGRKVKMYTFRNPGFEMHGNPINRTDGDQTEWIYDQSNGLLMQKIYADGSADTYEYDQLGQMITVIKSNGNIIRHDYAPLTGEKIGTHYNDGTSSIQYSYDLYGNPLEINDSSGTRTFQYNEKGDLVSEQQGGNTLKIRYNELGKENGYQLISGLSSCEDVTYHYDSAERISGITHFGTDQFSYSYDQAGQLVGLQYPNAINKSITLAEKNNRPLSINYIKTPSDIVLKHEGMDYDNMGRLQSRTDSGFEELPFSQYYAYNNRSELINSKSCDDNDSIWAYDNIGNRETAFESQKLVRYKTNKLNQYKTIQESGKKPICSEFDRNGNQTKIVTNTGTWLVTYNAENRPVKFEQSEIAILCQYDYLGRRISKKISIKNQESITHYYIYKKHLLIAEFTQKNTDSPKELKQTYMWDACEQPGNRPLVLSQWNGNIPSILSINNSGSIGLIKSRTPYFYSHDHNNNVTTIFDFNGKIPATYRYTPYGEVIEQHEGLMKQNPFCFSSEYHDHELALVYYNYRHYNPKDGRWLSRDPQAEKGGENLYGFVNNSPVNAQDYLGLGIIKCIKKWLGFKDDLDDVDDINKQLKKKNLTPEQEIQLLLQRNKAFGKACKSGAGAAMSTPGTSVTGPPKPKPTRPANN